MTVKKKIDKKFPSELRLDVVSRDWVFVAKVRGKRPEGFIVKTKKKSIPKSKCPFCDIKSQGKPLLIYTKDNEIASPETIPNDWTTVVIPNKFPALIPVENVEIETENDLYEKVSATGFCELVITDSHTKYIPDMELWQVEQIIDAYQQRYLALKDVKFINHIHIFHNHGPSAGASQPHNHSQIITTPLVDPDSNRSLINAQKYYNKEKTCIYCKMLKWEKKVKKRIVYENDGMLVICPFASKLAFQMIITPKKHSPYFEKISDDEKKDLADALQKALKALKKGLNDPDYNFYLKTAPSDGNKYPAYHWHITILPKTDKTAGFELGSGMEICTIEPEKAADFLKKQL